MKFCIYRKIKFPRIDTRNGTKIHRSTILGLKNCLRTHGVMFFNLRTQGLKSEQNLKTSNNAYLRTNEPDKNVI